MLKLVSDPDRLNDAWSEQYSRLASQFSEILPDRGVMVEVGFGRGQLSIPLIMRIRGINWIGVDSFKGPYAATRKRAVSEMAGLKVVVSDYRRWFRKQASSKYDAIFSSEFLPKLDSESTVRFLSECYRLLKHGGRTVHSFLSPDPRNAGQKRLIEADSNPRWTKTPPAARFSPTPKQILENLRHVGFKQPESSRMRSELRIRSKAAKQMLVEWGIRESYWSSNRRVLEKEGLEVPDWIIIAAKRD